MNGRQGFEAAAVVGAKNKTFNSSVLSEKTNTHRGTLKIGGVAYMRERE
jgi:hypothetical protein